MGLGRRRRGAGRRPLRLGRKPPNPPSVPDARNGPAPLVVDSEAEESTLIDAPSVKKPIGAKPQDETESRLQAIPRQADPNEETEEALDKSLTPLPPDQILFKCACGVNLLAKRANYDKRLKCGGCKTLLLLNLVFVPDTNRFMIEPFRVEGLPELGI